MSWHAHYPRFGTFAKQSTTMSVITRGMRVLGNQFKRNASKLVPLSFVVFPLQLFDLLRQNEEFLLKQLDLCAPRRPATISNQPETLNFGFSTSKLGGSHAFTSRPTDINVKRKLPQNCKPPTTRKNAHIPHIQTHITPCNPYSGMRRAVAMWR